MGRRRNKGPGGLAGFRRDLADTLRELDKRTSAAHKRWVLGLVLLGTVLRVVPLWEAITWEEAFAYVHFAAGSWSTVFSDRSLPGNHILHTALVKAVVSLTGVGDRSVRLPDLVAGILVMPLWYVFVRAMFNRYVALLALALVAGSGPLVEFSALSRGTSMGWLLMVLALLAGRHFVKHNNPITALVVGLLLGLSMWTDADNIHLVLMVVLWLLIYLSSSYSSSLSGRLLTGLVIPVVALIGTLLFYLPVISATGMGHILDPGLDLEPLDRATFSATHQEAALDLWFFINASASPAISLVGMVCILFAVYVSGKYRQLMLAMLAGAIPLVVVRMHVPPPPSWTYILFLLHLGTALAVFYLLKVLQERVWSGLTKRLRTVLASLLLFAITGYLAMDDLASRTFRYGDARSGVTKLAVIMGPEDRCLAMPPWQAPMSFYLMQHHLRPVPTSLLSGSGDGTCYVLVAAPDGQELEQVLRHHELDPGEVERAEPFLELERSVIFAVRMEQGRP